MEPIEISYSELWGVLVVNSASRWATGGGGGGAGWGYGWPGGIRGYDGLEHVVQHECNIKIDKNNLHYY